MDDSLADFQPLSNAKITFFSAATEVLQSDTCMHSVKVHASEEVMIC